MPIVDAMDRWFQPAIAATQTRDLSVFAPASGATQSIVDLAVLVLAISALIFIVVEGVLLYSIWRFRAGRGIRPPSLRRSTAASRSKWPGPRRRR